MYFETDANAKMNFLVNSHSSDRITLDGINPTLRSADSICAGIDSLMAIGGNTPYYLDDKATRTVTERVFN